MRKHHPIIAEVFHKINTFFKKIAIIFNIFENYPTVQSVKTDFWD